MDRKTLAALLVLLAVAGTLRFWSLSWGLRQVPLRDESLFVESVARMVRQGDFDQRFYEYPGLFFYLLRPVFSFLPAEDLASARAYLAARSVVAAFGVASVALVFLLAARLATPRAGLVAALFAAVSPIEVITAHMVRPDVVLETFALAALLAFSSRSSSWRAEARSGIALGAAAAVKFTGAFLVPSYLVARLARPGGRVRAVLLAAAAAVAAWLAATPYAWLAPRRFWHGVTDQWTYHYRGAGFAPRFAELLAYYLETLWNSFGPVGLLLLAAGLVAALRRWRDWGAALAFPAVLLVVLCTAEARWSRLLVPALGALAAVAGLGFEWAAARLPRTAWAVAVAGALWPLADSVAYVRDVSQPDTRDRALAWIEAHVPKGARVLTNMPDLGLVGAGYETLQMTGVAWDDRARAGEVAAAVLDPGSATGVVDGLARVADFEPTPARSEAPRLEVFTIPDAMRPAYHAIPLVAARTRGGEAPALADGDPATEWVGEVDQDEWVEVDLAEPACVGRVELLLGDHPQRFARALALAVSVDGRTWIHSHDAEGRGPVPEQIARRDPAPSQVRVTGPIRARSVRIDGSPRRSHRWGIADVRVEAVDSCAGAAGDGSR